MNSATSAAWASVVVAAIATAANIWSAYDSHIAKRESVIAKETLDAAQVKVISLQNKAAAQDAVLSNAMDRVKLYGDILAAEGGDRFAYKRAQECLWSRIRSGDKEAESLSLQLSNGTRHFWGGTNENQTLQNALYDPGLAQVTQVDALLQHKDFTQRLKALKSISLLRLNSHIPAVVEELEKEPNLNVVQFAVQIINETFNDNMIFNDPTPRYALSAYDSVFGYDEFRKHFYEMWDSAKGRILARKQKEIRERHDPQRGSLQDIFDPENPNEHKP